MNQDSNIELFDIDSRSVNLQDEFVYLQRNGFLLCKRGQISLLMDHHTFTLHEGDLFVYPAFSQTFVGGFSPDLQGIGGTADFDFVLGVVNDISDTQSHIYIRTHPLVHLTDSQRTRIERIIHNVRDRRGIDTLLNARVQSSLVQTFCYEVIDAFLTNEPVESAPQSHQDKVYQTFLIHLHRHFRTRRDVQFYADLLHLTPRYFSTLIRQVSGKSPLQWISMFVVIEAKHLLANPKTSIKEIAAQLNFSEQSFFCRYFKQYAGLSPTAYRNSATVTKPQ